MGHNTGIPTTAPGNNAAAIVVTAFLTIATVDTLDPTMGSELVACHFWL